MVYMTALRGVLFFISLPLHPSISPVVLWLIASSGNVVLDLLVVRARGWALFARANPGTQLIREATPSLVDRET